MFQYLARCAGIVAFAFCLFAGWSCAHDQELVSVEVQPQSITFGGTNIPVPADAGLAVQLRALGHYIHPPVTKDITNQVVWTSDDVQEVTVNSTGLLVATGIVCGPGATIAATVQTNSDASGRSSSGALVTGNMTANVTCFTGTSSGTALLTITFVGSGTGTVSVSPSGFICSATCSLSFPTGTGPIMLTAATNGTFGGWSTNCPSSSGSICTISSLTTNLDLTATFN